MKTLQRTLSFGILALALLASPARAQEYDGAVGYGGGYVHFGDFGGGGLALDAGWLVNVHAERWLGGGRFGWKAGAAFTRRPLDLSSDVRNINTWMFDGTAMVRVLPAEAGRVVAPFVSLGAGVISYGLGDGSPVVLDAEGLSYSGDDDRQPAGVIGFGIDVLPGWNWFGTPTGVRIEVADHVALRSPFESLRGGELGPVHNPRLTVGLVGLVELLR